MPPLYWLKGIIKKALEELLPFQVSVQTPKGGIIKDFELTLLAAANPDIHKQWELLSGAINHVTGTRSEFALAHVVAPATYLVYFYAVVEAAQPNGIYPLDLAGSKGIIKNDDVLFFAAGDAAATVGVRVLETDT